MSNELHLEIITPEKVLYSNEIKAVEVPGRKGRFTILRDHAPIISVLEHGSIRIEDATGAEQNFDCIAGYLECAENKISILLNS